MNELELIRPEVAAGYYGPFGGRYVPETLVSPLDELTAAYESALCDPAFQTRVQRHVARLLGPPHAAHLRRAPHRADRRRANLSEARRPGPHRLAQDQQCARPGSARPPHGQAPHHRRNRSRTARSRQRHGLRALRHGVRCLHGNRGHAAAGAECLPHALARRGGARRRIRLAHAERRHQRGACAIGSPMSATLITCSAALSAPIPIRAWCATSSR